MSGSPQNPFLLRQLEREGALPIESLIVGKFPFADVRRYSSLNEAITALGSSELKTILISTQTYLTAALTIPANIHLHILRGGRVYPGNYDLTCNGPITAGAFRWIYYTGTGRISFGSGAIVEVFTEWWGAKADNATASFEALGYAVDALKASKMGTLKFLPGIYQLSARLTKTWTNRIEHITLEGAGPKQTVLRWVGAASGGISFTFPVATGTEWNVCTIKNLSLETDYAGGGTALYLSWPDAPGAWQKSAIIENITISGENWYNDYWTKGISITGGKMADLDKINIAGHSGAIEDMTDGIEFFGHSTAVVANKCYMLNVRDALNHKGTSEGIYVHNCHLINVKNGITKAHSVDMEPQLMASDNHIAALRYGITLTYTSDSHIVNNLLHNQTGFNGEGYDFIGINIDQTAARNVIKGNIIEASPLESGQASRGIVVGGDYNILMDNLIRHASVEGIWLTATALMNMVSHNAFYGCTTDVLNQGGASNTLESNKNTD